jgi:hypothetical protein
MTDDKKDWGWYVGHDDEVYTSGPETYEDAVRIAREEYEGAHICEAYKDPVPLSSMFDVHNWLEQCEERACEEYLGEDGRELFDVTTEQATELQGAVRAAIEKWQSENKLTFTPFMFTEARNHEYIQPQPDTDRQEMLMNLAAAIGEPDETDQ